MTRMSMQVCVLASGSAGNCTIVRTSSGTMLIDAGLGPRTTATRMHEASAHLADVSAILLTHLDRDHFNLNWARHIAKRGIALHCHRSRVDDVCRLIGDSSFAAFIKPFGTGPIDVLPGVSIDPISLAHDADGSHGYVIQHKNIRMGFATDLGHVPGVLIDSFTRLDFLAIESNYDVQMQQSSARPFFLKRRIMGGCGHLSNDQAFDAVQTILTRGKRTGHAMPRHVVLLHRSRECNCPVVLREKFERDRRLANRLTLAEQDSISGWLSCQEKWVGEQMAFGW